MTPLEEFEAEINRRAQIGLVEEIINVAAEKHARSGGWRECACEFCVAKRHHTTKINWLGRTHGLVQELTPGWMATPEMDYPARHEWYADRIKAARRVLIHEARNEFDTLKEQVL